MKGKFFCNPRWNCIVRSIRFSLGCKNIKPKRMMILKEL